MMMAAQMIINSLIIVNKMTSSSVVRSPVKTAASMMTIDPIRTRTTIVTIEAIKMEVLISAASKKVAKIDSKTLNTDQISSTSNTTLRIRTSSAGNRISSKTREPSGSEEITIVTSTISRISLVTSTTKKVETTITVIGDKITTCSRMATVKEVIKMNTSKITNLIKTIKEIITTLETRNSMMEIMRVVLVTNRTSMAKIASVIITAITSNHSGITIK